MNWVLNSLVMFAGSVVLYLAVRKAQLQKINIAIYSIAMFLIPSVANFFIALKNKIPLFYDVKLFGLVIVTAFVWSYLGNFFSQRAILVAPNPGYSLILSKSYVILTAIAAVFLFNSELTITKMAAILLIVIFSTIISIGKDSNNKVKGNKWVWLSLGAHLCWAYGALISKYFLNQGLSPFQFLSYIGLIVAGLNFLEAKVGRVSFTLKSFDWALVILIGISSWIFNLFAQFAYQGAPNPGYVSAINASSIMAVTLLSALIFGDSLSLKKFLGIVGVMAGLVLIVI